jgi:RHS repeat-associated protein
VAKSRLVLNYIAGYRSRETSPINTHKTWYFEPDGKPFRVINERNWVTTHRYNGLRQVAETRLPRGNRMRYSYDWKGNVTKIERLPTSGGGALTTQFWFHGTWNRPTKVRDARGQDTLLTYNDKGELTRLQQPAVGGTRPTTVWTYNGRGQLVDKTDPTGRIVRHTYHEGGKKTLASRIVDPAALKLTTTYTYDGVGNLTHRKTPRGHTTRFAYDKNRNMTSTWGPAPRSGEPNSETRWSYTADNLVSHFIKKTSGTWERVVHGYYNSGKLAWKTIPTLTYDGSTPRQRYYYDDADRLIEVRDPLGRRTRYDRYADGKLSAVTEGYGTAGKRVTARFAYHVNGTLGWVEDGKRNRTSYYYDGFDRRYLTRYAKAGQASASDTADYEQLWFDANDHVTRKRTRAGQNIYFRRDALGRLTQRDGGGLAVVKFTYDLAGRMTVAQLGDGSRKTVFSYDKAGRSTKSVESVGTWNRTVLRGFDKNGQLIRLQMPGYTIDYVRDALERVREVKHGSTIIARLSYDQLHRRTQITRAGITTRTSYWPGGNPYRIVHDGAGTTNDVSLLYSYNFAGQMVGMWASDGRFIYNPGGVHTQTGTFDGKNKLLTYSGITPQSDANANQKKVHGATLVYDALNRVKSSNGAKNGSYDYDHLDRRARQAVASKRTLELLYNGGTVIADYTADKALIRRYIPHPDTGEILLIREGTALKAPLGDRLGSVIAVGQGGALVERRAYGPFGRPSASCFAADNGCVALSYSGQRFDKETGLYDYVNRHYDPSTGRFLQPDPIGQADNVNVYTYVGNDPLNYVDPLGTEGVSASGGEISTFGKTMNTVIDVASVALTVADVVLGGPTGEGIVPAMLLQGLKVGGKQVAKQTAKQTARRNSSEQSALIDMAKRDKRAGISRGDADAYKDLGNEVGVPVRGPEVHPGRSFNKPHIHVGPVDHIPVK